MYKFAFIALIAALFAAGAAIGGMPAPAGKAVLISAPEVKWSEVPGLAGLQIAVVEGNSEKGAHHMFLKYKDGFIAPVHHHSPDHFVSVVAGTLVLVVDGKEHRLPPGSYFSFQRK